MYNLFRGIKNLFLWFPVIWHDRQWDSYYYETLLLHKIKLQRKYFEKVKFFVGWDNEVKWMKKCEYLLGMLVNDKYWEDEWDEKIPSKQGFDYQRHKEYYDYHYSIKYKGSYADIWESKARNLFWKIFIWRYKNWWD